MAAGRRRRSRSRRKLTALWLRLNSICSFNCFYFYYIYICLTLATRSADNYDNNKDTLCPSSSATMSCDACRHGQQWTVGQSRAEQERDEGEQGRAGQSTGEQGRTGETRAELGSAAADSEYNVHCTLDMGPWDWQTVYTALHCCSACSLSLSLFTANCTTNCFLASVSESNLRHCAAAFKP